MSTNAPAAPDPERRRLQRQRVLKGALVVFGAYMKSFDCLIRNLTMDGAKLTLADARDVPSEFHLYIPAEHRIAEARAVWRKPGEMGIAFTGPWRHHIDNSHPKSAGPDKIPPQT